VCTYVCTSMRAHSKPKMHASAQVHAQTKQHTPVTTVTALRSLPPLHVAHVSDSDQALSADVRPRRALPPCVAPPLPCPPHHDLGRPPRPLCRAAHALQLSCCTRHHALGRLDVHGGWPRTHELVQSHHLFIMRTQVDEGCVGCNSKKDDVPLPVR